MATRKDQLHSYQFMMQRVISSVMVHETDPEQTPLRRGVGAVFGGVMLTGLLAIAFGVYGVVSGNIGSRWQTEGAVVIERETGAHFILEQGHLQPVLNYASARLLTGSTEVQRVPARSLAGIARKPPVGIPGAPDSLPPADQLVGPPWTLCSAPGTDPSNATVTSTTLLTGGYVPGSFPLGNQAVLVRDAEEDTTYLIWNSYRYRITGETDLVIRSLYAFQAQVVAAGTGWLNGLPAGEDIALIEVADAGEPSAALPDYDVGDLVFHPLGNGQEQHYLVLADGLAYLTELQMLLVRGEGETAPQEISPAVANTAPTSDALAPPPGAAALPPGPPPLLPVPTDGHLHLCAETVDASTPPLVAYGGDVSVFQGAIATIHTSPEGTRLADWVLVPPGRGAVVRSVPSESAQVGPYNLVTDLGLRFPVPTEEALSALGYNADAATDMPAALVARIPAGPTLDPAAARQPAPLFR